MAKLKPWYQVVTPREDLRERKPLDAAEFAVHLDHIRANRAHEDYVRPERFFERTYLTQSLLQLSAQVARRLAGEKVETSAVFNMATQFGGGKTHSLTALYHLARHGPAASKWKGVSSILTKARIKEIPKADVAVFVGTEFDPLAGRGGEGEPLRRTPWGEVAWQLGQERAFEVVSKHDTEGVAPGGDVIRAMLPDGPALVLMDELMNYVSRSRKSGLGEQLYSFVHNLSEEARARDSLVLAVSIPGSELEMNAEDQRDYESLKKLLDRLGKAISMSTEGEVTEIIRRRLFEWEGLNADAKKTVAEYAEWAHDHAGQLANVSAEHAREMFAASYPFHPAVISVFERKWQTLPRFQRTRGVLRLLALWVSRVYAEGYSKTTGDALIDLGTAPLDDPDFLDALLEQLGEDRLRGSITTDIAGKPDSHSVMLDNAATPDVKKARLHRKAACTILFESNGGQSQQRAEATVPEIRTALGGPELNLAEIEPVLDALSATCFYLIWEKHRYRFGLKPNLNQMRVTSRGNVREKDIEARLRQEIDQAFKHGATGIDRKRFPKKSNDVPDRPELTFGVLGPEYPYGEPETDRLVEDYIRNCGGSGRTFKSALIFAVPDESNTAAAEAKSLLAWEDIDADAESKAKLDDSQRQHLAMSLRRAERDLQEAVFRSDRHVMLLGKDNRVRHHDLGQITSSSVDGGKLPDLIVQELEKIEEITSGVGPNKLVKYWPPAMTSGRRRPFETPSTPRPACRGCGYPTRTDGRSPMV